MISNQICEIFIYASALFCVLCKIWRYVIERRRLFMNTKKLKTTLTSIPENNENEEEGLSPKWVSKRKHEALKAKYKCLKKLFQIYDASVISMLPDPYIGHGDGYFGQEEERIPRSSRRRKRSHRTKTDACAGTTSSGEYSEQSDNEKCAVEIIRDYKKMHSSYTTMEPSELEVGIKSDKNISTDDFTTKGFDEIDNEFPRSDNFNDNLDTINNAIRLKQPSVPCLVLNEKRKITRFQSLMHKILGLKTERPGSPNTLVGVLNNQVPIIPEIREVSHMEKKRKGLRLRRVRRAKKMGVELSVKNVNSPLFLSCKQSVQKSCLLDTTPRQCPIRGCRMMLYGIINYNDHLNLCHFPERKYTCHYCHEGFDNEFDKISHENEHIGINRVSNTSSSQSSQPSTGRQSEKKVSVTQTEPDLRKCDVPEEKLKKIVSFFDKIVDSDQILTNLKGSRYSESNLHSSGKSGNERSDSSNSENEQSDKRAVSCSNLDRRNSEKKSIDENLDHKLHYELNSPVKCSYCKEDFRSRRQLSLHVDLEHRVHEKYSKFHHENIEHSTAPERRRCDVVSENGKIKVQSVETSPGVSTVDTCTTFTQDPYDDSGNKSDVSLHYEPSSNAMYYSSMESVKKSTFNSLVQKVKSGVNSYRWESGTKIIRI